MAIKLYDYSLSGSCYKVRLLLQFLGLDYERQQIDFFPGRQHKSLDFLEINLLASFRRLRMTVCCSGMPRRYCAIWPTNTIASGQWLPRGTDAFGPVMMWVMFAGGELMTASAARLHDTLGYKLDIAAVTHLGESRIPDPRRSPDQPRNRRCDLDRRRPPDDRRHRRFPYVALSGDGGIGHEEYPALRNWMRNFRKLPRFHAMSGIPEFA